MFSQFLIPGANVSSHFYNNGILFVIGSFQLPCCSLTMVGNSYFNQSRFFKTTFVGCSPDVYNYMQHICNTKSRYTDMMYTGFLGACLANFPRGIFHLIVYPILLSASNKVRFAICCKSSFDQYYSDCNNLDIYI